MVSPSKIFITSNSGLNFGVVSSKKDGLRANGASKLRTPSTSQLTHSRLLSNTRFYLDIKNRFQLDKVETVLKSYGAKIEVFFRKGIKVIVTDKAEWMGNGQSPSFSVSSLTPSPSTNQDQRFAVPRSRASAMLEKVSQQPASSYTNPLELVQKWRIPVLSVRSLWKWIAKVEEAYVTKLNEKKEKLLESKIVVSARDKAPFIKIESIVSRNIPEFLELETWPSLNLDGRFGQCPFRFPSPPSPTVSEENPQEVENKLFEVKDKVSVELIQYDTYFRIKDQLKLEECEEEGERIDISENHGQTNSSLKRNSIFIFSKMTRRPTKNNAINNEEDPSKIADLKTSLSPLCNGYSSRSIIRQSSQELLKVQCNGLTTSHRNSKLLSPSGSDVLPLPTSRRSTRRASASWCGSTRELSQLSPTDSEIENIRRSDSSFESHDPALDSPGITLRPKGQLWLPIALIGTTAEENGNGIRKRYEYSIRQSENAKLSSDLLDEFDEKPTDEIESNGEVMPRVTTKEIVDSSLSSISISCSPNDYQAKKVPDKKDPYCILTRKARVKNDEVNGRSRESSVGSHESDDNRPKKPVEPGKKRSLSVCGRTSPTTKRIRTMSTNSFHSIGRKKKLSPEEKLLQDNREYFKMEVLNTKLRSTGSLLGSHQTKEVETNGGGAKGVKKIDKIIIKEIKVRRRRRKKKGRWGKVKSKIAAAAVVVENKKSAGVKINGVIRKKRQSELMKLCNEAECFMFGESSRQAGTAGGSTVTGTATETDSEESSKKKSDSSTQPKSNNVFEETSTDGGCENEGKTRKKRRSHAEAFIHDNLDYYKFETPGSRLRYQGSLMDVKSEDKDFIYTLKQKRKEANRRNESSEEFNAKGETKEEKSKNREKKISANIRPSEEMEKILFSFESVPVTEPWYEVYKRQDEGMENYYPLLSNPNDQPFLLPYELPKPIYSKMPVINEYLTRRRKKLVHLFNHPRKSPRCHASTLAILSSLKKRKRRSGTNLSTNLSLPTESPPSNNSTVNSPEEKLDACESPGENEKKQLAENNEILDLFYRDESNSDDEEEILLEPLSESEGNLNKTERKNGDHSVRSVKSDEEETKSVKSVGGRGKKQTKSDSNPSADTGGGNEEWRQKNDAFLWQTMNPDDFYKDMLIETGKKAGPMASIVTILEGYGNCKSMECSDLESSWKNKLGRPAGGSTEKHVRRRKKKGRKINKTGWDNNRKPRRRTGNKIELKEELSLDCSEVKENRIKTKVKMKDEETNSSANSAMHCVSRKRSKKVEVEKGNLEKNDHRPVLRSHLDPSDGTSVNPRQNGQDDVEIKSDILDSTTTEEHPSYVLRVKKKMTDSGGKSDLKLRCSNGRYTLQKTNLGLNRRKKRVIDYAWTTKKR